MRSYEQTDKLVDIIIRTLINLTELTVDVSSRMDKLEKQLENHNDDNK